MGCLMVSPMRHGSKDCMTAEHAVMEDTAFSSTTDNTEEKELSAQRHKYSNAQSGGFFFFF